MARRATTGFRWSVGALALSLGGHALALVALPRGSLMSMRVADPRVEIIEILVEPPPVPEQPEPDQPEAVRTPRPSRPDRPLVEPTPEATPTPEQPAPTPTATAEPTPTVEPPPVQQTPPVVRPVLDPRSAARSVLAVDGPRTPRPAALSVVSAETPEQRDRRLESELNGTLAAAANARPWGRGRELPQPVRRADGTLAYALGQVTAIVNPDGSFGFDDTGNVQFGGMGNAEREGMQVGWGLEEWMMRRHGDDPHAATRRWFANQTESMRDSLAQSYVERQAAAAARGMRGRMTRILADASLALEERHRRIFAIWDDCAEGEIVGDAVRAAVVTFVRENLALGSELAFTEVELDTLNRTRESVAEFRPYRD